MKYIISRNYSLNMAKKDSNRALKEIKRRRTSRLMKAMGRFIDALTPVKGRSIVAITGLSPLAMIYA